MKFIKICTLLLGMAFAVSASAIDFNKPTAKMPQGEQKEISAAPETTSFKSKLNLASQVNSKAENQPSLNLGTPIAPRQSAKKVVVSDDGIIYVTAEHFAYVEKFEGGWFMSFFSDEQADGDYFMFKFHLKSDKPSSPAGHYTDLSQLLRLNYGHSESAQLDTIRYQRIDLTVTEDEDGALKMEGDVWGKIIKHDDYGKVTYEGPEQQYHYLITQPAPIKPKEEKNLEIVCNPDDCEIYPSEALYFGKDEATGLYAQVALKGGLTGEFDKDHIMSEYTLVCTDVNGSNAVGIAEQQTAYATLTDNKLFDINTSFVGTDSIRYNIHMTLTLPDGGEPIDVKITNAQAQSFWGYFMTQGYNDVYDAQVSGEMKMGPVADFSTLSAAVAYGNKVGYALFFHDAELSTDANDQLVVTCSFYANDYKEYKLDMRYVVSEAVDNIDVFCSNCEYINALEKEQAERIQGDSDNGDYTVQITVIGTETTEGEFDIDGGNVWGYIVNNNTQRQMYFMNGTVKITMDADENITAVISADAMDTEVHHFNITMLTKWDSEYMEKKEYDAQEGELTANFGDQDEVTKQNFLNSDGYLYLNAYSAERGEVLTLVIYAPKQDKNIFIPEGTYTIADTEELWTIQPCPGVYDGVIYPSYYAKKTAGGLEVPVWMLERGTMTVTKVNNTLTFVIDAINSYKRPIHITYNGGPEGISNVTTLPNRTDALFNLSGQRISRIQKGINIVNGRKEITQ